jgi:hypothetical protein
MIIDFMLRICVFAYEYFVFLGRVTSPSAKPPFLEDLVEEEIMDAPGNGGNSSMPEQVKGPNSWKKKKKNIIIISC